MYNSYLLRVSVRDMSGQQWINVFNKGAEQILKGVTAKDCELYIENNDIVSFENVFRQANFKRFLFICKVTTEFYQVC